MYPKIFGAEHLTYILISLAVGFAVCFFAKRYARSERAVTVVLKSAGAVLLLSILASRLALVFEFEATDWLKLLPDTFCSASSYVLALTLLFSKRSNCVIHFIWLVALAGGLITTFYPNFLNQNPSFFYPSTIFGMIHHTWAAIVVMLMLLLGFFAPTYKRWYCTPIGFTCYLTYGAFLLCVLGWENPFYMTAPILEGTPLTVWVIAPIYMSAYALILLACELARRKSKRAGAKG